MWKLILSIYISFFVSSLLYAKDCNLKYEKYIQSTPKKLMPVAFLACPMRKIGEESGNSDDIIKHGLFKGMLKKAYPGINTHKFINSPHSSKDCGQTWVATSSELLTYEGTECEAVTYSNNVHEYRTLFCVGKNWIISDHHHLVD